MAEQAHLVFRLGEYSFALDIRSVTKIHDLAAEPEAPAGGEEFNLGRYFGVAEETRRPFRVDVSVDDRAWCFRADAVEDIQGFGLVVVLAFPPMLRTEENRAIEGFFFDGLRLVHQVDAAALMSSAGFGAALVGDDGRRA
jgi:chemotaxis signal transduction protein